MVFFLLTTLWGFGKGHCIKFRVSKSPVLRFRASILWPPRGDVGGEKGGPAGWGPLGGLPLGGETDGELLGEEPAGEFPLWWPFLGGEPPFLGGDLKFPLFMAPTLIRSPESAKICVTFIPVADCLGWGLVLAEVDILMFEKLESWILRYQVWGW